MAGHQLFFENLGSQDGTEKLILLALMPEPGLGHLECFGGLRGVSVLLEILQNSEQLELLPSLYGTTEFGVLARELKVFSVVLARSSSGISGVTELLLQVQSPVVFLPLCGCILCSPSPSAQKSKQEETVFSHLLVRMLKP